MTNTERLYTAIRDFTDKRRENRETYLRRKKSLEGYRGSAGYQKDLDAAMKIRKDADEVARKECQKIVDETIADMVRKNGSRTVTPPTEEQIRILTVAQMIRKPSKEALDMIANSLKDNALALAALNEYARDAWKDDKSVLDRYVTNYEALATSELSAGYVNDTIRGLGHTCAEIMKGSGANRVREMSAERNARIHGGSYDPDELPQEEQYTSERDFYKRETGVDYALFSKAVN